MSSSTNGRRPSTGHRLSCPPMCHSGRWPNSTSPCAGRSRHRDPRAECPAHPSPDRDDRNVRGVLVHRRRGRRGLDRPHDGRPSRRPHPRGLSRVQPVTRQLSLSVTDLLIRDTSGDPGLPSLLGWVGMLPCLPGLIAVTLLWRDRATRAAVVAAHARRASRRPWPMRRRAGR